ncbi:hypothetical protein LTR62_000215 [Meristemomyces frigidus]|uniref:DNA (cytosine-5)-methyltransferase 1 replication foci domain-containing protein n=1 Tax=Meristemomyces frigidus TaxID=1508187 RepID=A0AAN7TZ14_9PEZI|nr:hypothetical protein LTR62_000215 [Meristemomyces frigidus]
MNTATPEADVLKPLPPSLTGDSDEWPEFELTNACAYHPSSSDRSQAVSLLTATEHNPLVVVGQLQLHAIPKKASHLILHPGHHGRSTTIEIGTVRMFAYGQYANESVALWAGGKSGWFALKPARAYRATYNEMTEAIKLWYWVTDAYREERRSGKGKAAKVLPPYGWIDLCDKYATELIRDPSKRREAMLHMDRHVDFLLSSMLAKKEGIDWTTNPLYLRLRQDFPGVHKLVVQRMVASVGKAAAAGGERQQSIESTSTTSSLKRKRGKPPTRQATDSISAGSSTATTTTTTGSSRRGKKVDPTTTTSSRPAPTTSRRTRRGVSESTSSDNDEPEPSQIATPVAGSSESDEDPIAGAGRTAGKSKSALRLKPSKAAKGKRSGKAPLEDSTDSDEVEPASSPTDSKRIYPVAADPRRIKRENSTPNESTDSPVSPPTPTSPRSTPPDPSSLSHIPDSVQEDTWLCALDGCTHKVYIASQPASQRLIREHYALHAYSDDDARVRLVQNLRAPSLPVGRLMEKVRLHARFGLGSGFEGSKVGGSRFPEPVVQRC